MEPQISRLKQKKFWIQAAVLLILVSIAYGIGTVGAKVTLEEKKVSYEEITKNIESKEKKLASTEKQVTRAEDELVELKSEFKSKETEFKAAADVLAKKESLESEITKLDETVKQKQNEVGTLDQQIATKDAELATIEGRIIEKKEEPKILPAGIFSVGKDIPAGRYKVVSERGNGNFFVNDGMDVNIMLGKGDFYLSEYIFQAKDGDEIEQTLSVRFIPVQ